MKNEDKPYVDNYPPLAEWLKNVGAFCNWQIMRGAVDEPMAAIEAWTANGRVFIVQVYANKHGWEIFTAADTVSFTETLNDAEVRLGRRP